MSAPPDLAVVEAVRAGEVLAADVCEGILGLIQSDQLGCFWNVDEQRAVEDAEKIDGLIAAGRDAGPIAGLPVAVKDCFDVEGLATTGGVRYEAPAVASADAEAVARLRRAGAVVVGKTSMHQLAWGMSGQAPGFPPAATLSTRSGCRAGRRAARPRLSPLPSSP